MMTRKKIILSLLLAVSVLSVHAQLIHDTIPYKKDPRLPSFKITLTNNTILTKEQLPKNVFTVIVYFSPDCPHCMHEIKEVKKNIDKLSKVTFVWVSYKPMPDIKEVYEKYEIQKYPNMYMGRDPEYQIPTFYRVKFTPFVAAYDKKGLLIKAWDGGVEMPELLPLLK
jgi:thiol-disulfide isomerase/thioredoxin